MAVNATGCEGGGRSLISTRRAGGRHVFHKKKQRTYVSACWRRGFTCTFTAGNPRQGCFFLVVSAILCIMM